MQTNFLTSWKVCNLQRLSLEEKDRFLFHIYRKQETKVTFVNRRELIARPFVPSAQFSSFMSFCHSRGTSFRPPSFTNSLCAQNPFSPSLEFSLTLGPPQTLPCLYCFLRPQARYSLWSRKKRRFYYENATSALLRCTRTILPEWSNSMFNFIIRVLYKFFNYCENLKNQ